MLDEETEVFIQRDHLLDDVLAIYGNHQVLEKRLKVKFTEEDGEDYGGLTKDFMTSAWKLIFDKYFRGENVVVPHLPLNVQGTCRGHFIAIGRLLCHTASVLNIIPPRLSKVAIMSLVFGDDSIGDDLLIEDFLLFSTPFERHIVQLALSNYSVLNDRQVNMLTSMFTAYGYMDIPRERSIRNQLLTIARSELVDKPAPLLSIMKKGMPPTHIEVFWSQLTIDLLSAIQETQMPTGQKVVDAISTGDAILSQQQANVLYYLQQYCLAADHDELAKFLWFATGSTVQPTKIEIIFTSVRGFARRPVAHTCTNTLELSDDYWSVQDLREEFRVLLASDMAFHMNMI